MLLFLAMFFSYVAGVVSYFMYLVFVIQQPVQDEVFMVLFFAFHHVCLLVPGYALWNLSAPHHVRRWVGIVIIALLWATAFLVLFGGMQALLDRSAHLLYVFACVNALVYQAIIDSGQREQEAV